ncbi:hypothetical protein EZV62_002586 [Acer yangbiense]|uniref:Protein FAR1-RELATED SEQUENCE n=1 Tax=Acer yangbiense TaxID=1000413 RepID=A0A5C7IXJ9_9ROSI|nr:hypothetical protein EZV62_002586 [Acer yangbiense]
MGRIILLEMPGFLVRLFSNATRNLVLIWHSTQQRCVAALSVTLLSSFITFLPAVSAVVIPSHLIHTPNAEIAPAAVRFLVLTDSPRRTQRIICKIRGSFKSALLLLSDIKATEVKKISSHRDSVDAYCDYASYCRSCMIENLSYEAQLRAKEEQMEEATLSCEKIPDDENGESQNKRQGDTTVIDGQNGVIEEKKEFVAPAVGMEFESYDDAYNYYNCYAKELGFRVRVKNSWFKRNSREKYGAVLCCSSQGFKRIKDVNRLRKETRTGCPAMIRMRLVDSKRWRILEVTLEHNHILGAKIYRSIKKIGTGTKRKSQSSSDAEGRTIKLYRALVIDAGENGNSEAIGREVRNLPNHSSQLNLKKVIEFEAAWGFMVQRFGVVDHEWLRSLYEDRARWAPVYLKDTFFVGMCSARPGDTLHPFFHRYVHKQTPLKEFLDKYELALQKRHKEENLADIESRSSIPTLKTRCPFELQLSKVYTREIFKKFQLEVEEMYSCFSTTQLHVDGPIIIFLVKERVPGEGSRREIKDYEVLYNRTAGEVRCICSCFNFYGYLCRHALCVLNFNGVEEIPPKYVLSRWKKDYKRLYIPNHGSNSNPVDGTNRELWFNQLYKGALQVVEEGVISLDHYKVALQAFEESLNRVHDVEEKQE